jgi:transposase-like protein
VFWSAAPVVKAETAKDATRRWNSPNKIEARLRKTDSTATWQAAHPKLAAIVGDDFETTLTFYDVDASTWQSLRSTNITDVSTARCDASLTTWVLAAGAGL